MNPEEKGYFDSFLEVVKAVNSTLDRQEVLDLLVSNATEVMNLKASAIRLLDEKQRTLELEASHGLSEKYLHKGPVDADRSIADAMEGKTISVYNVTEDPRAQYPKEAQEEGIASIISVPLRIKGGVIGVMRLYTPEPREFSEEEINSAEALAEVGAIAIENARMYEKIKRDYETLMSFREAVKAVNSTLDLRAVLDVLVKNMVQALQLKASAIRLLDPKKQTLELVASNGLSEKYLHKGPVDADKSVADAMEGKTISVYNVTEDPRAQYPKQAKEEGIASIISVPLRIKGKVIGVMRLYTPEPREFSKEEINSAEVLAETGAIAIENAKMYERIKKDYESIMRDLY
ncbi:MAG: GAF domain-containing protein [Syntrophobacterales bacterium]|jgi:signal transduction protein with GAF and PtsI domain